VLECETNEMCDFSRTLEGMKGEVDLNRDAPQPLSLKSVELR